MKNNRTVFRRILSLSLAIAMCISIQDVTAFAASEDTLQMKEDVSATDFSEEELSAANFSEEELSADGNEVRAAEGAENQENAAVLEIQKAERAIIRGVKQRKEYVPLGGYQITANKMGAAFMEAKSRFPQYFISGIIFDSDPDTGMVAGAKITYDLNAEEAAKQRKEMEQAAAEIVNTISSAEKELKDYEKAWLVCQWLSKICKTDESAADTAYSALVNKTAQSKGCAAAYQYIMRDLLGIPCLIVKHNTRNLYWNMVKIDGKYYHVDVSYSRNESYTFAAYGDYFLLTDGELIAKDKNYHGAWVGPYDMEQADGPSYKEKNPLWMQTVSTNTLNNVNDKGSGIVYYEGYFYFSIAHNIYRVTDLLNYDIATTPKLVCKTDSSTETWTPSAFMACWVSISEFHDCLYFNGRQHIYRLNLKNSEETEIKKNLSQVDDVVVEDITTQTVLNDYAVSNLLSTDKNISTTYISDLEVGEDENKDQYISFQVNQAHAAPVKSGISCYYLRIYLDGELEVTGAEDKLVVGQELKAEAKPRATLKPDHHSAARAVYRWYRDDFVICKNTTGAYTTTEEDIGKTLRVAVTYDNYKKEFSKEVGMIPKQVPSLPDQLPTGISVEKGGALKNIALPEGYEWKNPDTVLDKVGKQSCPVTYCPDIERYETIDASVEVEVKECSHVWDEGKITKPAKCKTPGERTYTCTKCGGTKKEEIKARGTEHRWDGGKVIKKATCTKEGKKEFSCLVCGDKKTEVIEKASHSWKKTGKVTKEPTAKEKGTFTTTCSVCNTEKTENLLYAKTGNFTSGMTYVKVRSSAKDVNDNNVVAKLKKNVVIRVFEKGSSSTWTKICYDNRAAYLMSKYVVQDKDDTPEDNTPEDDTPANGTPKIGSTVTVGKSSYKLMKNNTVEFTKMNAVSQTVTIPATVKIKGKNYKVTSVAAKAMKNNKKVKKVVIGKNITKIGAEAFRGCKNLNTITIKSSKLKSVGKNAIKGIYKKAKISCPKQKKAAYKRLFKSSTGYKKTMKII